MPLYTTLSPIIQDIIQAIPQVTKSFDHTDFQEIQLRQKALQDTNSQQCLRQRYELTLWQDVHLAIVDNVISFDHPIWDAVGKLQITRLSKDLAVMKQVEVIADEYNRLSRLQDKINDALLILSLTCSHNTPIDDQTKLKIIQILSAYPSILKIPVWSSPILDTSGSPLRYQDVFLFLKDLIWQSQIYLSKGDFVDTNFAQKFTFQKETKRSVYQHINLILNPEWIKNLDNQYACARDTSLDPDKVCRKQEAQFWQILQKIVGKSTRNTLKQYETTVGDDAQTLGEQINDDTDSLRWSYKASIERINNAVQLLRESNFGFSRSDTQDQLLESYYNRSIDDIRQHMIVRQFNQWWKNIKNWVKDGFEDIQKFLDLSARKQARQDRKVLLKTSSDVSKLSPLGTYINAPVWVPLGPQISHTSPSKTLNTQYFYTNMTNGFNELLQDLDKELAETISYDPTYQMTQLPAISKKIYETMVTLGDRDQQHTLIHELNAICKTVCGSEGHCG